MPSDDTLAKLIRNNFDGEKSWAYYNDVLMRLGLRSGAVFLISDVRGATAVTS